MMTRAIIAQVLPMLADRMEQALQAGKLNLTLAQFAEVQLALFPELFAELPQPSEPTASLPMTVERLGVYTARAEAKLALFHRQDAGNHLPGDFSGLRSDDS